jgi:hypothetical protein
MGNFSFTSLSSLNDFTPLSQVEVGISLAASGVMKNIIIVSRCLSCWPYEGDPTHSIGHFSFRGFYAGTEVASMELRAPLGTTWKKGEDYLMYVKIKKLSGRELFGDVLRARLLSEIMMQD